MNKTICNNDYNASRICENKGVYLVCKNVFYFHFLKIIFNFKLSRFRKYICLHFLFLLPLVLYIRNKRQHFLGPNHKKHRITLLLNFFFNPNDYSLFPNEIGCIY